MLKAMSRGTFLHFIKIIRSHLIAIAFYSFLSLLFFNEVIFQKHWFGEDFFSQNYPNRVFAVEEIQRGHFPLWNPYVFSGMPFFADIQTATLYPFNLLLSVSNLQGVNGFILLEYQVIFHFVLGAWFFFVFLKALGFSRISSLLGGTVFAFSGYLINQAHHTNIIYSSIWLPAIFFCCLRGVRDSSLWIWGCPIVLTVSLFGGHPQMTLLNFYAFTAYYFFLAYNEKIHWKPVLLRFLLISFTIGLLSLVQILPTAELLQNSSRSLLNFREGVKDSLPFRALWNLFFPELFLNTYQSWQWWEFRDYSGLGTLALAFLGVATRLKQVKFFLILAIFSLTLSFGDNTPLYKLAYQSLPGLNFVRVPARFLFLFSFALSALAAYGFSHLNDPRMRRPLLRQLCIISTFLMFFVPFLPLWVNELSFNYLKPHLILYFILLAILIPTIWLGFRLQQPWTKWVLMLLIIADLLTFRGTFNQIAMTREIMIRSLKTNPVALVAKSLPRDSRFQVRDANPLYANFGLIHRVSNIYGYNPFNLADYFQLEPFSREGAYLLGARLIDSVDREEYMTKWKDQTFVEIYKGFMINPHVLPRAFFVTESRNDPNINIWARLEDKTFDPLRTVYLERELLGFGQETNKNIKYQILNWKYDTNKIELDLQSNKSGFLVLTDVYYPGWQATVNEEKHEVLKANSALRAIAVNQFPAHVVFEYCPLSFKLGAAISVFTALAWIAFGIRYHFKNRKTCAF